MSIRKKIFSGIKWTTLSTFTVAILAIVKLSVLAGILEKSDFGLMALVISVMGMMHMVNDLGLGAALLHKKEISAEEYASVYWFNWLMGLGMYLLILLLTPMIAAFYGHEILNSLLPIAGLGLLISGFGFHFKIIEQKHLRFRNISIIEISGSIISLLVAVGMALKGYGVYALVYSLLLQSLVVNLAYFGLGWRGGGIKYVFSWTLARPFLRMGSFQVGGQIVNIFNKELDILLIGKFFSAETLGIYSLAKQLVQKPIAVILPIVMRVGTPALAGLNENMDKLKKYFLQIVRLISGVSFVMYAGMIVGAEYIIAIIYGDQYAEMITVFRILCIYMILRNPMSPVGILTTATGRTDLEFRWNIITLLVSPLFIYFGTSFGIEGVALALVLVMGVLFLPFWAFLVRSCSSITLKEYTRAIFLPFWGWR